MKRAEVRGDTEFENGSLIEHANCVPEYVERFAHSLVIDRRLGEGLEWDCVLAHAQLDERNGPLSRLSELEGFGGFRRWIHYWATEYARCASAAAIKLCLSHVRRPTCPRFHVDRIRLRLIATLYGPGTEWLHPDDVKYDVDGRIKQDVECALINRMHKGSVGLFPGACAELVPKNGVVHRSPLGHEDRVILKIDKIA